MPGPHPPDPHEGTYYANIALRGPEQAAVCAYLAAMFRDAYVSPLIRGVTVVYDREGENQNPVQIGQLAAQLSGDHECPALAALVHNSAVLWYRLYSSGELLDEYTSDPGYSGEQDAAPHPPTGGDAATLCAAFGAEASEEAVRALLRRPTGTNEHGWPDAVERHRTLARLLGLPPFAVGLGYYAVSSGEGLLGSDTSGFARTR